jgi:hypothetical protein
MDRSSRAPNAHPGQRDPYLVLGQAQARRDLAAVGVQPLGGHEQVHAAVVGGHGQAGLRAEEGLILHADLILAGHHHGRDGAGVPATDPDVPQHVAALVHLG